MKHASLLKGILIITVLYGYGTLHAQFKLSALKVGYMNPKRGDSGLLLTTDFTLPVDEAVELGISTNLFYTHFQENSTIAEESISGGLIESQVQQELEYSTLSLPLYGMVNIIIPSTRHFGYQVHGGLGWELTFNKEDNYLEGKSERRFYHGLTYLISAGFHYIIGSRSALTGEMLYHSATVSRDKKMVAGLPTRSEVNLSGLGFRFGIRFQLM